METKYTPGPWAVDSSNEVEAGIDGDEWFEEFLTIVGPDKETICELPGHSQYARGSDRSKREDANARLIAAAPEMLDVLLGVAENTVSLEWRAKVHAVIAKATGR